METTSDLLAKRPTRKGRGPVNHHTQQFFGTISMWWPSYIVLLGLWCGYYYGYVYYYGLFIHYLLTLSFQPYEMRLHGWCALPVYMQVPLISQSLWAPSGHIFTDPHALFTYNIFSGPEGHTGRDWYITVKSIVTLRGISDFVSMLLLWYYHSEEVPIYFCSF